ncbi:hypothetical protein ACFC1R_27200 [Kitasatospora sp. NPDC056138]|uniref:hypothetical protein n=1 Tax=Kitasatospora sp. NPDC056138 TaxID=3345724 RepID=UPI0035D77CD5
MIAELQQAVAHYAHALDELKVPALEAVLGRPGDHTSQISSREAWPSARTTRSVQRTAG